MKNTKRSITLKVLTGYLVIGLLVFFAIWLIYPQLKKFIAPQKNEQETNQKLTYTSSALSYLYEAETIGRTAMATGSHQQFSQYKVLVDSITLTLDSLQVLTETREQNEQLDSIKILLNTKTNNINAMVRLREEQYSRNYYDEALDELIKEDIYFEDYENDPRLDSLDAYSKRVYVEFLEYIRKDNADTDQSMASMAETVRKTLAKIEKRKKKLELNIINRENTLLANDRDINLKIRNLLNGLERESSLSAKEREAELNNRIEDITQTLQIIGIVSIVLAIGFVILIFKDASRSQQYNKELQESNAVSQALLKSREQLMATITHDMRSPLNTVIGFTDLLKKTPLDPRQSRYLETVRKSGDYILNLVNDLLDFAKLEAGKITIEKIPFNPKKLVEDVVTVSLPAPLKSGVSLKLELDAAIDGLFISDPFRIKQILSNLITNAYKFTDSGSITIKAESLKDQLRFQVIDTGCGIPKEKQQLIFKEFSQAEETTQRKYGGFGLGLSISQKLTELLHGKLELTSEPGKGSTFICTIPVKKTDQNSKASEPKHVTVAKDLPQIKSVLIVDDEPVQIELAQATLAHFNLTLATASNGKEALAFLENQHPDLILSDIQMPVMDGITLIKSIKTSPKRQHIPVIALSGNATLKDLDYKDLGFAEHLKKPYKPDELLKAIQSLGILEATAEKPQDTAVKPDSKLFNVTQLKAFVGDDQEALNAILEVFCASTHENLDALNNSKNEVEKINRIAHKMLPMMRQLEASALVSILQELEQPELKYVSNEAIAFKLKTVQEKAHLLLQALQQVITT